MILLAFGGWYHLFRQVPDGPYANDEEHFKYGSLSKRNGFPAYVMEVLPTVFADKMPAPGDWTAFGFIVEEGKSFPIGWGVRTVGFPGITFNCAMCHTGTWRAEQDGPAHLVVGAPAHQLDFAAFQEFLFACAEDPRFNGKELLAAIEERHELSLSERLLYRTALIPGTRKAVLKEKADLAWTAKRPPAGPGRTDAFNLLKINILKLPDDGSVASSDYLPLWHQEARKGLALHWNGSGTDLRQENLISGFSVVMAKKGLDEEAFDRVSRFLAHLPAARYPFETNAALVEQGRALYQERCADCHAFGGSRVGQVTPATEVGTDPTFLAMMTPEFVKALEAVDHPPFVFDTVRITDGYLNIPLDGCWLRAPYLHNGSVPTLADLLAPPAQRPARFQRGGDVYDPERLGFSPTPSPTLFDYDTTLPGNGNGGHEYGTELAPEEKEALLEFLKTL